MTESSSAAGRVAICAYLGSRRGANPAYASAAAALGRSLGEHRCDLVVVGSHGLHGIERVLLGSDAERVVRLSPVPVLVVRQAPST